MASSTERFSVASQRCARSSTTASPASSDQRMKQPISYKYSSLITLWGEKHGRSSHAKISDNVYLSFFSPNLLSMSWMVSTKGALYAIRRVWGIPLSWTSWTCSISFSSKIILKKQIQNNFNHIWSHLALPNQPQNSSYQLLPKLTLTWGFENHSHNPLHDGCLVDL